MSLSAFAVKKWPIVVTATLLLMVWGVYSFLTMPRREDPEYTVRTCAITTVWPGVPVEKVEELVTKKLEEAVDSLNEVDKVRSTTTVGLSTIYVDAEDALPSSEIANVWDKVRARVAKVQMPEPNIVPIVNDEFGDTHILVLGVYQTPMEGAETIDERYRYSPRQLELFSEQIRDALRLLPGVAKVERFGIQNEAIYITTDSSNWAQLNLKIRDLQNLLEARNIVAPGGNVDTREGRFAVKPGGEFNTVEEIESTVVGLVGGDNQTSQVYLRDLGLQVVRGYEDPSPLLCRFGDSQLSQPAVMVAITMKSGANIIDICDRAKQRVRQMQEDELSLPPDLAVTPVSDQSQNVEAKIGDVVSNVIGAVVIVVAVVFLVVGLRTSLVMAANIPVVVLVSVALLPMFGVQLEQISLASIIIALGLLVDNAVQVCDQSRTNQISGMLPRPATIDGANTLAFPMLNGTLTTIAAFAPMLIALIGSKREYIYSLPVTLTTTLATSWLLAMTFCVILAAAWIRPPADPTQPSAPIPWMWDRCKRLLRRGKPTASTNPSIDWMDRLYGNSARFAIRHKFITVGGAFALLAIVSQLPVSSEFFPKDRRDQFAVQIWLPESAAIEQTNEVAKQVERMIQAISPGVDAQGQPVERLRAMRTLVGGGGSRWYLGWNPEARQPNYAEILIRTTDGRYTPDMAREIRQLAQAGDASRGIGPITQARVIPKELYLGPSAEPIELRVTGMGEADPSALRRYADRLKSILSQQTGTWDIYDSWGVAGYQLHIDVDEDRANLAGITNADVARTLNAYLSGHRLTTFREGDHLVPVYLRLSQEERESIDVLNTAFVEGANGKIPLESIATPETRWEPGKVERRNLNRVISVRSQVESGYSGNDIVKNVLESPEYQQLVADMPPGYFVEVGGSLEESAKGTAQLAVSLAMSMLAIVLCLVIQYNGWAKPIIILATLPLALIGAIPGLYFTGNALGFMPQLGILSLFGIVLNTGIIFMEFADQLVKERAEGAPGHGPIVGLTRAEFHDCLVEAGKLRMLPIFLTTATTIGGLLPLAVAGGPLWEGMSWCMIFGLTIATVLTLYVVPSLYAIFAETFRVPPVQVARSSETPNMETVAAAE